MDAVILSRWEAGVVLAAALSSGLIWTAAAVALLGQAVVPTLGLIGVVLSLACVFLSPILVVLNGYAAFRAFAAQRSWSAVLACAGIVAVVLSFWLTAENGEWNVLFVRVGHRGIPITGE